jgi:hypothetical protein
MIPLRRLRLPLTQSELSLFPSQKTVPFRVRSFALCAGESALRYRVMSRAIQVLCTFMAPVGQNS